MRKLILLVDDKETIAKVASIYLGKDYDIQAGIGFIVTSHIKRYSVKGNIDLLVSVPK